MKKKNPERVLLLYYEGSALALLYGCMAQRGHWRTSPFLRHGLGTKPCILLQSGVGSPTHAGGHSGLDPNPETRDATLNSYF